jgi:hypothetical protein
VWKRKRVCDVLRGMVVERGEEEKKRSQKWEQVW